MVREIRKKLFLIMVLVFVLLAPFSKGGGEAGGFVNSYIGTVIKIYDGDTITVQDEQQTLHRVRLYAIDAPELKQEGGEESWKNLVKLLSRSDLVQVAVQNKDLYGREVGVVYSGGVNVNRRQVAEGYAWHYRQYDRLFKEEFAALQRQAKEQRLGIWRAEKIVAPWIYRKTSRRSTFQNRPSLLFQGGQQPCSSTMAVLDKGRGPAMGACCRGRF